MKNRYKVISDYPNSPYKVGQIISSSKKGFKKYSKIFKRLEWWEEIPISKLPRKLKSIDTDAWGLPSNRTFKVHTYSKVDHEPHSHYDNLFVHLDGNFDRTYRVTEFIPVK